MAYHIDEANSNVTFEVRGNKLIITAPAGSGEGGGMKTYIITSEDGTEPSDANLFSALRAIGMFLRKDQDDRTEHSLEVGGELTVDGRHTVGGDQIVGGSQTIGGSQTVDGASLIKGLLSLLTGAASPDFLSGFLGTGFELRKIAETGRWRLEIDELLVRVVATFFELVIQKLRHVGGSIVLSPASMQCIRVEETADAYRCYFKASEGDKVVANEFVVGDQARCQSFNLKALDGGGVRTSFYWRLVTAVGDDWIELSKTDCAELSGVPEAGDDIVHLGNRDDVTRQNAIILDTVGSDAPSIKQYHGINSYVLTDDLAITVFSSRGNRIRGQFVSEATGKDYDESITSLGDSISSIGEQMQGIKVNVDAIKEQTDKEYTLWFGTVDPTTSNAPASEWQKEEDKAVHEEDIYYNRDAGHAWRWTKADGGSYAWVEITDQESLRALEKAAKAQDTADGKRRNFVSQPTDADAYDVGDTWSNATYGTQYSNDTLVCIKAKAAGEAFSITHWQPASNATTAYIQNLGNEIRQVVADNKASGDAATAAAQKAADDAARAAANAATAASGAQSTANSAATSAANAATAASNAQSTADTASSKATANATAITQTNSAISALSGKFTFDSNGNVKNIDKSGLVLTSQFASLYSASVNADTNVVKKADISAMVTKDANGNIVSGVKISADQITMNGMVKFATPSDVSTAKSEAISTAASDATTKADNAQSAAATDAQSRVDTLKKSLGSLAYKSAVSSAMLDSTVISGGYIKTSLLDVNNIWVKNLEAKSSDGTTTAKIDGDTGKLTAKNAELEGCNVSGNITATSGKIGNLEIGTKGEMIGSQLNIEVVEYGGLTKNNLSFLLPNNILYSRTFALFATDAGTDTYTVYLPLFSNVFPNSSYETISYGFMLHLFVPVKFSKYGYSSAIDNNAKYRVTPRSGCTLYNENGASTSYIEMTKGDFLTLFGLVQTNNNGSRSYIDWYIQSNSR